MLIAIRDREPADVVSLIESDRWDHFIATAHAGFPVSKLKTDNISDGVRAYGQRQSHTRIQALTEGKSEVSQIDYIALIGINRNLPRAAAVADLVNLPNRARLVIDDALFDTQEPPINGTNFAQTNLTGSFDILNQVINPPEETVVGYTPTSLTATNPALDTQVIAQFDNYTSFKPLAVSSDPTNFPLQRFLVHVKNSNGAGTLPDIDVMLRQGVADIRTLTYDQVEVTDEGFIFTYKWDADELPNPSSPVLIKVFGDSNGSMVPVPISILWRATVDNLIYESTPLEIAGDPVLWHDNPDADIVNETMLVWRPNLSVPAGSIYKVLIELTDFSAAAVVVLPGPIGAFEYSPLGSAFVAGRFAGGPAINVPLLELGGANLRKSGNNQAALLTSYGGHLRANRVDLTRWEAALTASPQSQTRIFGELDSLYRDIGFTVPTLWIIDTADVVATLWAIVTGWESSDLGALIGEDYPGAGQTTEHRYDLRIGIIEAGAHSTKLDG